MTRRLAAIDVGTNSVLLTVLEERVEERVEEQGERPQVLLERATVTRLGQGVDQEGSLHPDACERTLSCLRQYKALLDELGATELAAVGTSALRDASNGAAFLAEAEACLGRPLEVISGQREAELTFAGALSGLDERGSVFVFDIGGGSTELVWGRLDDDSPAHIERSTSLALGSVRLHERFQLGATHETGTGEKGAVDPARLGALREYVRVTLDAYLPRPAQGDATSVIGVAGTVTTLAALCLGLPHYDGGLVHGASLAADSVRETAERLSRMTLDQRMQLGGLDRGRADVIVSGAWLCVELLDWLGARELRASDRGVRYGLLRELTRSSRA